MRRTWILSIFVLSTCTLVTTLGSADANATETKAEWAVINTGIMPEKLKAGEALGLSESLGTSGSWFIEQEAGAEIKIECKVPSFVGESRLTGLKEAKFVPLSFEGCVVVGPVGDKECEVSSTGLGNGKIRTQSLGFQAVESLEGPAKSPHVRFVPESSREEITTIHLTKAGEKSCTNAGSLELAGILVAEWSNPILDIEQSWSFGDASGSRVTLGGTKTAFLGHANVTLKSGKHWGVL